MQITISLHMGSAEDMALSRRLYVALSNKFGAEDESRIGKRAVSDWRRGCIRCTQVINTLKLSGPKVYETYEHSAAVWLLTWLKTH
jgi:hypothetical protein